MFAALHTSLTDTLRRCSAAARATVTRAARQRDAAAVASRPEVLEGTRAARTLRGVAAPRPPALPAGAAPVALPTRPAACDPTGTTVGAYQIEGRHAAGGMCQVYRAQHVHLGYACAVKVPFAPSSGEDRRRMRREAQLGALVDHPHVVKVLDLGQLPDQRPFLVMELLDGPSLRQVLTDGELSPRRACRLAAQVAAGLAALHRHGIVHRDIKPRNLLVLDADGPTERIKIIDLGLAKRPGEPEDSEVSLPGVVLGTPDYMAPEQLRGGDADPRTDQYALGCVLFEMLTGQVAADWTSEHSDFGVQVSQPPLAELQRHGLPPGLAALVQRMLAPEPADRFPSMAALEQALSAFTVSA